MRFKFPKGVAVDTSGFVYVTDDENHRVQKFDSNGNFISEWGSHDWYFDLSHDSKIKAQLKKTSFV